MLGRVFSSLCNLLKILVRFFFSCFVLFCFIIGFVFLVRVTLLRLVMGQINFFTFWELAQG